MWDWLKSLVVHSYNKDPKRLIRVFFDLDSTLFVYADSEYLNRKCASSPHLTKISDGSIIYMIYQEKTAEIFKFLLRIPNVRIGFITAADYKKREIVELLEYAYQLSPGVLKNCIYINRHTYRRRPKGEILAKLVRKGKISKHDHIVLVDDLPIHVLSSQEHGFAGIHSMGWFEEDYTTPEQKLCFVYSAQYLQLLEDWVVDKATAIIYEEKIANKSEKTIDKSINSTLGLKPYIG